MARILFPLPHNNTPSGGRKFVYHVVDFLNEAGMESWVVHSRPHRLDWFENNTRVGYCRELFPKLIQQNGLRKLRTLFISTWMRVSPNNVQKLSLQETDVLVIPETRLSVLNGLPKRNLKIIFNQGPFLTLSQQLPAAALSPSFYSDNSVIGIIVASNLNRRLHEFVFPEVKTVLAQVFIEGSFRYSDRKKIQFAFMPRRNMQDALAISNMVKLRGVASDSEFVAIDGLSQNEVVATLGESLIFLSFAQREGFGLPSAEAMASGCIVIGYTGCGGEEFFDPEYCFPVRDGDLCGFVETIENVVKQYRADPSQLDAMRRKASERIRHRYSREKSKKSVIAAFSSLLKDERLNVDHFSK